MSSAAPSRRSLVPADMETALIRLGIEIRRSTEDEVTCYCPKHEENLGRPDRHASWSVNRHDGLHNCFSCGYSGTFVGLVTELLFDGEDIWKARGWVRDQGMSSEVFERITPVHREARLPEAPRVRPMNETRLALFTAPPEEALASRGVSAEQAERYGVLWDPKQQCWIFPIRRADGELMGWQEKGADIFRNRPKHGRKREALFGYHLLGAGDLAIVVESPVDAPYLADCGVEGVPLATFGAYVSDEQMLLILERTNRVVFALDNDDSGIKAMGELCNGKVEKGRVVRQPWGGRGGLSMRFFNYAGTSGKDPGELSASENRRGVYTAIHQAMAPFGASHVQRVESGKRVQRQGVRHDSRRPWVVP